MTQKGLPNSDELAAMLLGATEMAADLGCQYYEAWLAARVAKLNRDLMHTEVVSAAYADGGVDGKNEAQRSAQLDAIVHDNARLNAYEESLRQAEAQVKSTEGLLEAARVYRAALHDLVDLRVAELNCIAKSEAQLAVAISAMDAVLILAERSTGRRFIEKGADWRMLEK